MRLFRLGFGIALCTLACGARDGFSQNPEKAQINATRVTVSMNADGSRTVYQFDDAQHRAVATTTGRDGELRQTIRYEMDDAGRFSSGRIFGANGRLRFVSQYKYDDAGRLQEETQNSEDGALLHKIVYDYDQNGKQTGYSIFDASGKLMGRTTPRGGTPSPSPKSREKSSR
jgi:YD repeat-containing protein